MRRRSVCNGAEACVVGECTPGQPPCGTADACDEATDLCTSCEARDRDGDGDDSDACGGTDCDDADPERAGTHAETCGAERAGLDEDCDATTFGTTDQDRDGFIDRSCQNLEDGMRVGGDDCDDAAPGVHPGVPDICGDAVDNDCDGIIDEGGVLYVDVDNDGRGDPDVSMTGSCRSGWVFNADDCDDSRSETYGGSVPARERCDGRDNDCSQATDRGGVDHAEDEDGDGHSAFTATCLGRGEPGQLGFEMLKDDCDDGAATTFAGAVEICDDAIDQDCDRVVDNPTQSICADADGDAHGDPATRFTIMSCEIPSGHVPGAMCDDCNDTRPNVHPGHREICDRIDNDCSAGGTSAPDEDADGDGYSPASSACAGRGEAGIPDTAFERTDCVDLDPDVSPGAFEVCDGADADCSSGGGSAPDEDADGDGYSSALAVCAARGEPGAPAGAWVRGDCDDTDGDIHPGRPAAVDLTTCDGVDNDCNVATSEVTQACDEGYCSAGGTCGRALSIHDIDAGIEHTCVALGNGTVRCWGRNIGALGDGTTTTRTGPVMAIGVDDVVELAAGSSHTCARHSNGTVSCWGINSNGQLGDGTTTTHLTATPVPMLDGVMQVAAGAQHTCALRMDATVLCWGSNTQGQLGDGTTLSRDRPTLVGGLRAVEIVAGTGHTCARLPDGTARCWGGNTQGALGDGTTIARTTPTPVLGLSDVAGIDAGASHTCAWLSDGAVRCWGSNRWGEIGDGTRMDRHTPVTVTLPMGVTGMSLAPIHTCAMLRDRTVRCWGNNSFFQLGDGTSTTRELPVAPAIDRVLEVATGENHSCVRRMDSSVWCWGANFNGAIGDDTGVNRSAPTLLLASAAWSASPPAPGARVR